MQELTEKRYTLRKVSVSKFKAIKKCHLTLTEPEGGWIVQPQVLVICCALSSVPSMNSKILKFFSYHRKLPLENISFQFLPNAFQKPSTNNKNLKMVFCYQNCSDLL